MGNYAQCWLGSFYVGSSKNDVEPGLVDLFLPPGKLVVTDRTRVPESLGFWIDELQDDPEAKIVYFTVPVNVVRDRLDLTGYTVENARRVFAECLKGEVRRCEDFCNHMPGEFIQHRLSVLKALTVDSWLAGLDHIKQLDLPRGLHRNSGRSHEDTLIAYMLVCDWYGFPGPDPNAALRLALETLLGAQELIYDVTDLALAGYFDPNDYLADYDSQELGNEHLSGSTIVVLTEGRTDSWILSESLQLLYPHLAGYYSFMDFEASRVAGGAGNLANLVKAFSGAGILNKTIAIFDNDTAAESAIRALEKVRIPKHIVVMRLPELEMLRHYPTLGPTGKSPMNVNGLAASIELFLGRDVLTDNGGDLAPVQWTGYESTLGRYQGEVLYKDAIHERFRSKLRCATANPTLVAEGDWEGLRAVFSTVFLAFQEYDGAEICNWARQHYAE